MVCVIRKESLVPVHGVEEGNAPDTVDRAEDIPGSFQGKGKVSVQGKKEGLQRVMIDIRILEC